MERLAEESILTDFTWIGGESRTNLAVIDPTAGITGRNSIGRNKLGCSYTAGEKLYSARLPAGFSDRIFRIS